MLFTEKLDVIEEDIQVYEHALLDVLLYDRTARGNILWATDNYLQIGEEYGPNYPILPEQITGPNSKLIQPRIAKSHDEQDSRTKNKAEVFTPSWVCNEQNNLIDEQWFGKKGIFNVPNLNGWDTTMEKIPFETKGIHTWKKYVDVKRLEVSCGEAPYLVSRYDTVTGNEIPIHNRIGLLDRKLRVVNENTANESEWLFWAYRAFQAVYGYEYQGDNLLLARENLLITFIEYYQDRFAKDPEKEYLLKIAKIISWNLWQMDGLKFVIPNSCTPIKFEEITLFGNILHEDPCPGCKNGDIRAHTGKYCKVFDWREKASLPFVSMMKGVK